MKGTLYLVNRAHPLPEEPAAEDLASVRSGQTEVRLHQRAKVMLDQLLAAVDGAGTIIPVSGYRPQTEQQAIWEDALAEHGKAFTETYVARPGCSEHQTGLAIDLGENRPEVDFLCPASSSNGSPYITLYAKSFVGNIPIFTISSTFASSYCCRKRRYLCAVALCRS